MKYNFLFVFLIICSVSYCQKIVDTIARYNGEMTNTKIEFDTKGNISKEVWYYKNGKIWLNTFMPMVTTGIGFPMIRREK
jgi:hypothetical protein